MWEIETYETTNGRCPVSEYIDGIKNPKIRNIIDRHIRLLSVYGLEIGFPTVRQLRDKIYELRMETIAGQVRLLFFFYTDRTIVMTVGLTKKRGAVPAKYINKSIEYRLDYFSTHGPDKQK